MPYHYQAATLQRSASRTYVTRYEKTDHSQLNMILQDGDLHSEDLFFLTFLFFSFCESITFSLSIHKISLQYNVVCLL